MFVVPLDRIILENMKEFCPVVLCSCLRSGSHKLLLLCFMFGLFVGLMTFSNVDIVKYLPMTLMILFFFSR